MRIQLTPYQPAWKDQFQQLKRELSAILQELDPHIEHIGSTSVEGLAAKPIIDVQVGVQSEGDFDRVVELMTRPDDLIYYQVFNETMPQRRLFVKLNGPVAQQGFPKVFEQLEGIPHEALNELRVAHIHVWVYGTEDWARHIAFREYLKAHSGVKAEYEALKFSLSQREWAHGMAYNEGKNQFIKQVEQKALEWYRHNLPNASHAEKTRSIHPYGKAPYGVALLHGGPGATGQLQPLARELSRDCGVLELLQTARSVEGQVEELREQLLSAAEQPVVLVGHSWGAMLGILFAAKYPDRVRKLILIGTPALESQHIRDLWPLRMARLDTAQQKEVALLTSALVAGTADTDQFRRFGELMEVADAYELLPDTATELEPDLEIFQQVWRDASARREAGEWALALRHLKCPVVALHGQDDPHPVEAVECSFSETSFPFKLVKLLQCGHSPWQEVHAKDLFYRILREELA